MAARPPEPARARFGKDAKRDSQGSTRKWHAYSDGDADALALASVSIKCHSGGAHWVRRAEPWLIAALLRCFEASLD